MRTNRGILMLTFATAAALAVPAVAAQPETAADQARDAKHRDAGRDVGPDADRGPALSEHRAVFPQPRRAAATVAAAGREARQERRERRGPAHPLAVDPDYGSAEAAFGAPRSGHMHSGQDVFAPAGSPLVAVSDGEIVEAGSDGSQGNHVYLYDDRNDRTYVYMHMIAPAGVATGDRVKAGQKLGGVGCTGSCWGDHLHFEVHAGRGIEGAAQDPLPLLLSWPRSSR